MYAQEIKIAQKLLRKQNAREGIIVLLKTLGKITESKEPLKKDYQDVGLLLASVFKVKSNRAIIFEYIKQVSQTSMVYFLNIIAEFGQLKAVIAGLEECYVPETMTLATLNFYLDILDSFMERNKALAVIETYLKANPLKTLGALQAGLVLRSWEKGEVHEVDGRPALQDEDIELFSFLFKLVKILYCKGRLQELAAIVKTLEVTVTANPELQTTKIKNGYNYFQYIAKLLPLKQNISNEFLPPVYLVGDSHCLSPAWESMSLEGQMRRIVPLLITGCKIWHLRDDSNFHAKTNFYRALECIPKGATVIFVFGEIDCREGILQEVLKGTYASSTVAIKKLIDIYIKRILETIKARSLTHLYVHQIPPVLDATRAIVREFNELLALKIRSLHHDKLSWLDFQDKLLTTEGDFNLTYALDDTHIHPDYIRVC